MLRRLHRLRAVRLRRLYVARAAAADPVERRERELIPRPALQPLEQMRARATIQHHFLPFGVLPAISQEESLNRRAAVVALLPLQLDGVGGRAGRQQGRRRRRYYA